MATRPEKPGGLFGRGDHLIGTMAVRRWEQRIRAPDQPVGEHPKPLVRRR